MPSRKSNIAATSSSNGIFPSTNCSSVAASSDCGADSPQDYRVFGARLHRRLPGKLATVIDQIEHGHHVFRAYFKHAFLKQYEKFATFLRNELALTTSTTSASKRD